MFIYSEGYNAPAAAVPAAWTPEIFHMVVDIHAPFAAGEPIPAHQVSQFRRVPPPPNSMGAAAAAAHSEICVVVVDDPIDGTTQPSP